MGPPMGGGPFGGPRPMGPPFGGGGRRYLNDPTTLLSAQAPMDNDVSPDDDIPLSFYTAPENAETYVSLEQTNRAILSMDAEDLPGVDDISKQSTMEEVIEDAAEHTLEYSIATEPLTSERAARERAEFVQQASSFSVVLDECELGDNVDDESIPNGIVSESY